VGQGRFPGGLRTPGRERGRDARKKGKKGGQRAWASAARGENGLHSPRMKGKSDPRNPLRKKEYRKGKVSQAEDGQESSRCEREEGGERRRSIRESKSVRPGGKMVWVGAAQERQTQPTNWRERRGVFEEKKKVHPCEGHVGKRSSVTACAISFSRSVARKGEETMVAGENAPFHVREYDSERETPNPALGGGGGKAEGCRRLGGGR